MPAKRQVLWTKRIVLLTIAVGMAAVLLVVAKVATADIAVNIPQQRMGLIRSGFDVSQLVAGVDKKDLLHSFPYDRYLDSANIWDINAVRHDLAVLDSVTGDPDMNRRTLSNALTRELGERERRNLTSYQPDSLLRLIQWAEQFGYYSQYDANSDLFYESVYQYWFDLVANHLTEYSNRQPVLRHDFKFKYLVARCYEKKFATAVKITDFEKFVDNILYSHWGHLINATWTQASWSLKGLGLLFFALTLFGAYALAMKIFLLIKKINS